MSRRLDQRPVQSDVAACNDAKHGDKTSAIRSAEDAAELTVDPAAMIDDSIVRWFTWGAVLGGVLYLYMAMAGSFDLLQFTPGGDRFDDQAKSLLAGHLYVDPSVATIES